MKKVILVTTFRPNMGGGAVILKSLLPYLKERDIEVQWLYLHDGKAIELQETERIAEPLMGGNLAKDLGNSLLLWLGFKTQKFKFIIDKILCREADAYWVVGYNEGVLIALELARKTSVPVHLTMHDDLVYGVFSRSRRYRWLSGLARLRFAEAMTSVNSVDVVSEGMRRYYQKTLGIDSVVIHRYLPCLPKLKSISLDINTLIVGHIGSIYSAAEFRLFCQALQQYAQKKELVAKFIVIGGGQSLTSIFQEFSPLIVDISHLNETEAIEQLAECNFLYAMYPFAPELAVFRQTSLPTKLTTYLQVQKPILAHTPNDSTLAEIVTAYKLGLTSDSLAVSGLMQAIEALCEYELNNNVFAKAREALFGIENVNRLADCLSSNPVLPLSNSLVT